MRLSTVIGMGVATGRASRWVEGFRRHAQLKAYLGFSLSQCKKGDDIASFLEKCRAQFPELRGISVENLMYIKVRCFVFMYDVTESDVPFSIARRI